MTSDHWESKALRASSPSLPVLHRRPRAQVVLEGAVDELDGAEGGFAEQAAADEKVAQDRRGVALRGGGREGRQDVGDDAFGTVAVHLGLVVADEPVGQALEELDLREFREVDAACAFGREHVALLVTARQQHGQGSVVQLLSAVRQIAPPVGCSAQISPHISGLVASRPRSGLVPTAVRRECS